MFLISVWEAEGVEFNGFVTEILLNLFCLNVCRQVPLRKSLFYLMLELNNYWRDLIDENRL